jgi:hypothetical protein
MVSYNVTFKKLNKYLMDNGINLGKYPERDFDGQVLGWGIYTVCPED